MPTTKTLGLAVFAVCFGTLVAVVAFVVANHTHGHSYALFLETPGMLIAMGLPLPGAKAAIAAVLILNSIFYSLLLWGVFRLIATVQSYAGHRRRTRHSTS
jgi:hypothetical protein